VSHDCPVWPRGRRDSDSPAPIFGRSLARDLVTRQVTASAPPPLICFYGVTKIGKSSLLTRILHDQRQQGRKALMVDLAEHATADHVAEHLRAYLTRRRRLWLFTRFAMLQECVTEDRPSAARVAAGQAGATIGRAIVQGATGAHPVGVAVTAATLPAKLWRALRPAGRRVLRRKQARWVRTRVADLPKSSDVPSQRRDRLSALDGMVPHALAADLAELVGRRGLEHLVLLFDHHNRGAETVEAMVGTDFATTLAEAVQAASLPVTVVLARNAPLEPTPGTRLATDGERDAHGVLQCPALIQGRVDPLTDADALEYITYLGVPHAHRPTLVAACGGHPYALELAGTSGAVPASSYRAVALSDAAMVQMLLSRTVDGMMAERDRAGRRLLRLASTVRAFDRGMLSHLAGEPVPLEDITEDVRRGVLRELVHVDGEPVWQVDPVLRALIVRHLISGVDREIYVHGHRRAIEFLDNLAPTEDEELQFTRYVERLHHQAALDPEQGLDELVRLADAELAQYRIDHAQLIMLAMEELFSFEPDTGSRAALVRAKVFSDLHAHSIAEAILNDAASAYPLEETLAPTAVAVELELAKSDRLPGRYADSLARYARLAELARASALTPVAFHAAWEHSLVLKQLEDLPAAREKLAAARRWLSAMLAEGEVAAARNARRYGIRQLELKPAHMLRHEAELNRLGGNYVAAHRAIEQAIDLYDDAEPRCVMHARVVRSQILRMEGCLADAVAEAAEVRRASELTVPRDDRLRLFATRAEVLARVNLGETDGLVATIDILVNAEPEIYPNGLTSGLLVHGELERCAGRLSDGARAFERAAKEALRLRNQSGRAIAMIGQLECLRATGSAPDTELDELLALECLDHEPWLALRAQLARAIARPAEQAKALETARMIVKRGFVRRDDAPDLDRQLFERVRTELTEVCGVAPIRIEVL